MLEVKKMNLGSPHITRGDQPKQRVKKSRNYKKVLPVFVIAAIVIGIMMIYSLFFFQL